MFKYICVQNCVVFSCVPQTLREVPECACESLCDECLHLPHVNACVITHKDAFGGKKKRVWPQRDKAKLLTGSHGNRGETDKGLPRKATFRLQRKTLPFNLTRLLFAVSPMITAR